MLESQKQRTLDVVATMQQFGLTAPQARAYASLVQLGMARASQIAQNAGIHRVDVYRILKELSKLQMIEIHLGEPNQFRALAPSIAVSHLLKIRASELGQLRSTSKILVKELDLVRRESKSLPNTEKDSQRYIILQSRSRGYEETKRMFSEAQQEVLRIASPNGIIRAMHLGLRNHYERLSKRGIKTRIITTINKENLREARLFSQIAQVRHSKEAHMHMTIVDNKQVLLSASFNDENMNINSSNDVYLLSTDNNFASAMKIFFENLWRNSVPMERMTEYL
ncbi:MAG: hypothetical protein JRN20_09330 [Nitrososphaerota archaeon]|nr:hypothetical protein [Nitrososphaerota archaeon]